MKVRIGVSVTFLAIKVAFQSSPVYFGQGAISGRVDAHIFNTTIFFLTVFENKITLKMGLLKPKMFNLLPKWSLSYKLYLNAVFE